LAELDRLSDSAELKDYPFYPAALGEFHLLADRPVEGAQHFERAVKLATEAGFFERKLEACRRGAA